MEDEKMDKDGFREKSLKRSFTSDQAKVKLNKDDEEPDNKIRLIAAAQFRLLDFSDEVLFEIFKYLDSWTLMALMNCCNRLGSLILDHRFWNYIDLSKEPLPLGILEDVLERSQANTTAIKLHGPPVAQHLEREDKQFSQTLAKVFANCCTNLSILELRGITIDFRVIRITDFPSTLKRLILNDCNVRFEGEKSIFFNIDTHLTKLEELAIENSNWFEPYYMMVFSKVPELRSLSLKGCQLLSDFVPYGSMAARFGFKKLEYLDLRFTPISDSDLQCFNAVATLKEVLLDCPESLQENNIETLQDTRMKIRNCYCHSRPNAEYAATAAAAAAGAANEANDSESPSTSNASRLRITVSVAAANERSNENSASTSAAAADAVQQSQSESQQQQSQPENSTTTTATSSQSSQQEQATQHEEDSSLSSCSSSPSVSSSSSNESLPPLLGNPPRQPPPYIPLELPLPGGNAPPFSRFLPRPDQIILLDINNRWRRVVMQNLNANNRDNNGNNSNNNNEQQAEENPQNQVRAAQQQQQLQQQQQMQQQLFHLRQEAEQRRGRLHPGEYRIFVHNHQEEQLVPEPLNNNNNNNNNNNDNNNGNVNNNQIEQVLNHPLFWDMINPLGRVRNVFRRLGRDEFRGEEAVVAESGAARHFECRRTQCSGQYHQYHRQRHRAHHHPISDRGICCFGRPRNPVEHGIIWIRIGNRPSENRFERLSIRNYKLVTDVSLQHLVQCSPYLVYLDLSGTGVTQRGIDTFKERKPQCVVVAEHLTANSSASPKHQTCDGGCIEE